jgi:hypothetical protein
MTPPRLIAWTVLASAGFALMTHTAPAQDTLPSKGSPYSDAINAINDLKVSRGIPAGDLETARKHFAVFAKHYAEYVKLPLIYKAAQDPSVKDSKDRPVPSLDSVILEMQRHLFEPISPTGNVVPVDRADYIREMGAALDAALKPVVEENPDRIVRVNATRMLAAACRTGATAHYPTVTGLLKNANTPVEVKNYALVAAGNLLGAYDVFDYKSRRHSNGWKQTPKNAGAKELAELVVEIEKHVTDPGTVLGVAEFKVAEATSDQKDVVRFVRRQAIKALGQLRFAVILGPDGTSKMYPAHTLARVCVSDPGLGVEPGPAECAEAAIGLCNMAPVFDGRLVKDFNADTAVEAVVTALVTFATPRAGNLNDKSLPWRGYGMRLSEAFKNWRPLFDDTFDATKPGNFAADTVPKAVNTMIQRCQIALFAPLDKVGLDMKPDPLGGRVDIEDLKRFLTQQREAAGRKPLFGGNPATTLTAPGKK